ncbi:MAG: AAA family ATPase [Planctomycetes bacterium]|nr:AAA family ATPase [Planctomycetota bacterium]MBL7039251.1 AAA family ATPase [Pirellulaceae bacterium]
MSYMVRLAIVDPDETTREELKNALSGLDIAWLEAECVEYTTAGPLLDEIRPNLVTVCLDSDTDRGIELIRELRTRLPESNICGVSASNDGQLILRAMRAGVCEFLTLPVSAEDVANVIRTVASHNGSGSEGPRGCTTIAVAGATGGVGSTSVAVNLASILATDPGKSVVLVDLDLSLGDADVFLDAVHDYTLSDVAENITRLDFDLLRRSLAKLKSGLFLLPRPVDLEEAMHITDDTLRRVLGLLKASFSHVILDLSKGYGPLDLVALECSDEVLLVAQLDLPNLRNVVRLLKSFQGIDGLREKVKIVVNRAGLGNEPIRLKKAQETIGQDVFWQVPNDYRLMVEVRNNGVPLIEQAPKAKITGAFLDMGEALCGNEQAGDAQKEDGPVAAPTFGKWLGFLPSMSSK